MNDATTAPSSSTTATAVTDLALQTGGAPPDYQAGDVNRVSSQIQASFSDGTVWKSELDESAASISGLSPRERQSLVNNLANTPQGDGNLLDKFLGEVTSPGLGSYGGLDADDRSALIRDLIPGQDGANLERVFNGLRRQQGDGVDDNQREFSRLTAWSASADQRIDFVARLADNAGKGDTEAARAIAQQIGTLERPADVAEAMSKLDRATLDKVVKQSIDTDYITTPSGMGVPVTATLHDPSLYQRMADAVATTSDPKMKAAFIASSGQLIDETLRNEPGQPTLEKVINGMSNVIGSDTNGVIGNTLEQTGFDTELGGQYASSGLQALRLYNTGLIETDQGQKIRGIVAQLRSGNDLQQDAFTRFDTDERAAYVLGGYTGTVTTALDSMASEQTRTLATTAIFAGTAIDTAKELAQFLPGKVPGIVAKFAAAPLKATVALTAMNLNAETISQARDQSQLTIMTAQPQGPGGTSPTTESREAFSAGLVLTEKLAR